LFLAPPALFAVYFGTPVFEAVLVLCCAVLAWEWTGLWNVRRPFLITGVMTATFGGAVAATSMLGAVPALGVLLVGAVAVLGIAIAEPRDSDARAKPALWLIAGTAYLGLPIVALTWIRLGLGDGRGVFLWLLAVVWIGDIGAYVLGRTFGGPRLAVSISPNKTWAGFFGAIAGATVVGVATVGLMRAGNTAALVAASVVLVIVAQGGDLAESWVKRRAGVKDTSRLIPGHGGLLDRLDGLLAAAAVLALGAGLMGGVPTAWM
jgi:phosphatidate cytidylyltransferase